MVGDLERLRYIEEQIDSVMRGYAKEAKLLSDSKGFDCYAPKWNKKLNALAKKYADICYPLKKEHDEIRIRLNAEDEEKRKNSYKNVT